MSPFNCSLVNNGSTCPEIGPKKLKNSLGVLKIPPIHNRWSKPPYIIGLSNLVLMLKQLNLVLSKKNIAQRKILVRKIGLKKFDLKKFESNKQEPA